MQSCCLQVLQEIADSKVTSVKANLTEQQSHVKQTMATAETLFDSAAAFLGNQQLRAKARQKENELSHMKQQLGRAKGAAERGKELHCAELSALESKLQQELQRCAAENKQQLVRVQSALEAEKQEHERTRQQLNQERTGASGLMVTLGESCTEAAWKRKLSQLKQENEGLRQECARLKRQCK